MWTEVPFLLSFAKSLDGGTAHCFGRNVHSVSLSAVTVLI